MKSSQFWKTVPRAAKTAAFIAISSGVLIGLAAGIIQGPDNNRFGAFAPIIGAGIGLGPGCLAALFILCLGYVYGDSRRRAMPPVLWTLIALLVPNLLGFLFYFALRKPLAAPCAQCGQAVETGQRFCSRCGRETLAPPTGNATSQPVHAGLGSNPT